MKDLTNALIGGAITGGVIYFVFKFFGTNPQKLASTIQSKVRSKL